jgi:hypothetical protein
VSSPTISERFKTDEEQLAALAAPFPPECHKQREEAGKKFTYLEHTTVVARLREVLGTGVSISTGTVIHNPNINLNDALYGYVDMEVVIEAIFVSGRKVVVSGWGESDVLATKQLDDDAVEKGKKRGRANQPFKSAFSDGLKVAAARLGVGAYLYDKEGMEKQMEEEKEKARQKALFTCQECQGEITPGSIAGVAYDTPEAFMEAARKTYRRRLCPTCAAKREV